MVSDAACDLIDRVCMWMPPWAIADHAEMPSRTHGRRTHTVRIYPSRLLYAMEKPDCACAEWFRMVGVRPLENTREAAMVERFYCSRLYMKN